MAISAKNNMNKVISSPDKGISKTAGEQGVLARLWRQMLFDLNVGGPQITTLLHRYIINPQNRIPDNKKDQISARGNIVKELFKPHMTWKVFCKGLRFLGIVKIQLAVKAYHYDGRHTLHETTVSFSNITAEQPEEQELVQDIDYLEKIEKTDER